MDGQPDNNRSRLSIWLPRIATLAAFVLSLGFLLHTSAERTVFGKYNVRYTTFLGLLFLVVLPAFYKLACFCSRPHTLTSASGRRVVLWPRHTLTIVAVGLLCTYFAASALIDRLIMRQALCFNPNVFHPYLQNAPRPNDAVQHVNRWGFRGDDIGVQKSDDTFRIFVFGGSTVYCGTVPYEQTHCRLLEQRLQTAYPQYRIEVQNLGAEWHTTEHDTIKLLFLAQDFSPDLVITFHAINDLVRSLSPDMFAVGPYWPDYRQYLGAVSNLGTRGAKSSMWVRAAGGYWCSDLRFDQMRLNGPDGNGLSGMHTLFYPKAREVEITEWKSQPAFERNLRDFVSIARGKAMEVLLATQPSLYREDLSPEERELLGFALSNYFNGQRPSLDSMIGGMLGFNDATRQIAAECNVCLVDLEQRMPKTTAYLYDDVHYTRAGNELIGNAFAEQIIESQIIDRVMQRRNRSKTSPYRDKPDPIAKHGAARR